METKTIQGLSTTIFSSAQKKALIVLHGYGANGRDLIPLRESISGSRHWDWYFPEAPLSISLGMGMVGKGWFPLRVAQLSQKNPLFFQDEPEGLREISETVGALVEEVKEDHEQIYLGGFSQGAIVAINTTMENPHLIHKLFILSGTLVNARQWEGLVSGLREIPTFQSHGREDMILPLSGAESLDQLLSSKSNHQFHPFSGGHEIPPSTLDSLARFFHG